MTQKSCLNCIKNCDIFKRLSIDLAGIPADERYAYYYKIAEKCKDYLTGE